MVVEGSVYAPVSEPRIHVRLEKKENEAPAVVVELVESAPGHGEYVFDGRGHGRHGSSNSASFALDRHVEATGYAGRVAQSSFWSEGDRGQVHVVDRVVVDSLRPEALREDATTAVARAGVAVVRIDDVLPWTARTIEAWGDLRDGACMAQGGGSDVAEALRRFVDTATAEGDRVGWQLLMAEAAVAEYDHAVANGRRWLAPARVRDGWTSVEGPAGNRGRSVTIVSRHVEGWTDVPRAVANDLMRGFLPSEDRLVRTDLHKSWNGWAGATIKVVSNDGLRVLDERKFGDLTAAMVAEMEKVAAAHLAESLARADEVAEREGMAASLAL
jgi:hypothetical protein